MTYSSRSDQAASGYIDYDSSDGRFSMSPEQVAVFADDDSPVLLTGGHYSINAIHSGRFVAMGVVPVLATVCLYRDVS